MNNPFEVLDVATDATDETIKRAYLEKVRQYPPDRDPAMFQTVRSAYDTIADQRARIEYALFHDPSPSLDGLIERALRSGQPSRPNRKTLIALLREPVGSNTR